MPKVSVLIPTYNSALYLGEAIESVLNQTYTDFELIILDNASTDNTDEVVNAYLSDNRVFYYKNDSNIGMVNNWNKVLQYAHGEYIKYLCADDKFHPRLLEKFVPIFEKYPQVSLVCCSYEEFGDRSWTCNAPFRGLQNGRKMIYETLKDYNWLGYPAGVMLRKENFKVGAFKHFRWLVDWEMWIRHLNIGDCYIIPEVLCYIRNHSSQETKTVTREFHQYFEGYSLSKAIQLKNGYDIDLTGYNFKKVVKKRAKTCALVIPHMLPKSMEKQHRSLLKRSLKIVFKERVALQSLLFLATKIFLRASSFFEY